ncbi:MAG: hypothetical protein B0W54_12585 [Cellvibrio sp. 79]|nr:MAG: hypothetical protein B0W54_12585 [Cellvibrio sp. 79]
MYSQSLAALANNTKWSELQKFMSGLEQRAPYWRTRSINGFIYPPQGWDGDWSYHFRLGEYKDIEWCEMQPRLNDEALSQEEVFTACKNFGFETEKIESIVKVIGYRRL